MTVLSTYLRRHWRGELSLRQSFLANMLLINVIISISYALILLIDNPDGIEELLAWDFFEELPFAWLAVFSPLSGGYMVFIVGSPQAVPIFNILVLTTPLLYFLSVWQVVGVFRAAGQALRKRKNPLLSAIVFGGCVANVAIGLVSLLLLILYIYITLTVPVGGLD